jgi:hypothetical protein
MVLTFDHAAEPSEVGLRLVRANAVFTKSIRVIDALRKKSLVQHVPMWRFVSMDTSALIDVLIDIKQSVGLVTNHESERTAIALAESNNNPTCAGLMLSQTTVNAILCLLAGRT